MARHVEVLERPSLGDESERRESKARASPVVRRRIVALHGQLGALRSLLTLTEAQHVLFTPFEVSLISGWLRDDAVLLTWFAAVALIVGGGAC
jgi:hypothetical protein